MGTLDNHCESPVIIDFSWQTQITCHFYSHHLFDGFSKHLNSLRADSLEIDLLVYLTF